MKVKILFTTTIQQFKISNRLYFHSHCPPTTAEHCFELHILHCFISDILPTKTLHAAFGPSSDSSILTFRWIVRYLTLMCCRGVIAAKGYIISLDRMQICTEYYYILQHKSVWKEEIIVLILYIFKPLIKYFVKSHLSD